MTKYYKEALINELLQEEEVWFQHNGSLYELFESMEGGYMYNQYDIGGEGHLELSDGGTFECDEYTKETAAELFEFIFEGE